jgi:hypothetical protein
MPNDVVRMILALVVLAHGIGHVLFAPALAGALRVAANGHSWLLTGLIGDGATRALASVVAIALLVAFVGAAAGIALQMGWARGVLLGAAIGSIVLVAAMWDGLPTSSALFGLAFDVVIVVAAALGWWPSEDAVGG